MRSSMLREPDPPFGAGPGVTRRVLLRGGAHSRISGNGRPRTWTIATILRIEDRRVAEQWEVVQDEASQIKKWASINRFLE